MGVWEMRCKFNLGRYWQRVQSGELTAKRTRHKHKDPKRPPRLPECAHSQHFIYYDAGGREVARVHQYVLPPDGSLWRKPDPKRLLHEDVLYHVVEEKADGQTQTERVLGWLHKQVMRVVGPIRCRLLGR